MCTFKMLYLLLKINALTSYLLCISVKGITFCLGVKLLFSVYLNLKLCIAV